MATVSKSGRNKVERAEQRGWFYANGIYGPCEFLHLSREQRRNFFAYNSRKRANNAWVPVKIALTEEAAA